MLKFKIRIQQTIGVFECFSAHVFCIKTCSIFQRHVFVVTPKNLVPKFCSKSTAQKMSSAMCSCEKKIYQITPRPPHHPRQTCTTAIPKNLTGRTLNKPRVTRQKRRGSPFCLANQNLGIFYKMYGYIRLSWSRLGLDSVCSLEESENILIIFCLWPSDQTILILC